MIFVDFSSSSSFCSDYARVYQMSSCDESSFPTVCCRICRGSSPRRRHSRQAATDDVAAACRRRSGISGQSFKTLQAEALFSGGHGSTRFGEVVLLSFAEEFAELMMFACFHLHTKSLMHMTRNHAFLVGVGGFLSFFPFLPDDQFRVSDDQLDILF